MLSDNGDRLGSVEMLVQEDDDNCGEEGQNARYGCDGTSGFVERPISIEIHEVKDGIDENEHEEGQTGDNKVVIVENIVIVLEVSPVHEKIAYDDPNTGKVYILIILLGLHVFNN